MKQSEDLYESTRTVPIDSVAETQNKSRRTVPIDSPLTKKELPDDRQLFMMISV